MNTLSVPAPKYSRNAYSRSFEVLDVLSEQLQQRDVLPITYLDTSSRITGSSKRKLGKPLSIVNRACRRLDCPKINFLVIKKDTRLPSTDCGINFYDFEKTLATIQSISPYSWASICIELKAEIENMYHEIHG